MSAFLGPIHYRMFAKAQAVDGLARDIAAHADAEGWTSGLATELDERLPRLAGEITDYIDLSNIHSSLNGLVGRSEDALALACKPLQEHLDELCDYARSLGREAGSESLSAQTSLQDAWQSMDDHWLDGMPCDRFLELTGNDEDHIAWSIQLGPHTAAGYEKIRAAWMAGFMEAADIELSASGEGDYEIKKAA